MGAGPGDRWDSAQCPPDGLPLPPSRSSPNATPQPRGARRRWSAQHRKTAIIGWILFVVLATVIGGKVGQQTLESSKMGNGESKRHDMIVDAAGYPKEIGERVLIQGKGSIGSDGPEVTAAVEDVVNRLERSGVPTSEPVERRAINLEDGRSVLVDFSLPGKAETNTTRVPREGRRRTARHRRGGPEGAS